MNKQPHLCVDETQVTDKVILCGDPARVNRIAEHLSDVVSLANNREFRLIRGRYNQQDITVCSTGIGAASAIIALEELVMCGAKQLIRVGSAGALQHDIAMGDLIIVEAAVRDEGGSASYISPSYPAYSDIDLVSGLVEFSKKMLQIFHRGIVRSHDSFYIDNELDVCRYWHGKGVLGADMETSALLTVGRLRGVQVASVLNNVVLYEQDVQQGISNYVDEGTLTSQGEQNATLAALYALTR
ncbi:nucleoside phosphorylase [Vibrio sp. 99-70-13A1]|uniref:nucleoside phosphorylase n=1 Tax=Vibrio sp. 99-70-13A1 TaxID=2607601 RepID=UPI001493688B|nr:nucleoside phosphorylase [Vibrio sp. 99-70-13A1]NOH96135.1 nucleoside phosphorylase [Vibrio sp. 99-70-13A1]